MNCEDRLLKLAQQLCPFELPIAVYVVTKEGKFVECNRRAREIFGFSLEAPINAFITDFYKDPAERIKLVKELDQADENHWLEKTPLQFYLRGRERSVHVSCRWIKDPDGEGIIGYLGCLAELTDEECDRQMFELLPAGIYEIDEEGILVRVNPATAKILGYDSPAVLIGTPIRDLYVNKEDERDLTNKLRVNVSVSNIRVELYKKNKETVFVLANAFRISGANDEYQGRKGTLSDVTNEERYHKIMEDVPVAFYTLRIENGGDIIKHCNKQFKELFEFGENEDVVGYDIRQLTYDSKNPSEYYKFLQAIQERDGQLKPLLGHPLKVKTKKGNSIVIEVNSRLLHDKDGNIIGRTGVLEDITEEAALREQVKEFTDDIGRVLHTYSSTLVYLQHSLTAVIQSLGDSPFALSEDITIEQELEVLREPMNELLKSLIKIKDIITSDMPLGHTHPAEVQEFVQSLNDFQRNESIRYPSFRPPVIRASALKISETLQKLDSKQLPQEILRRIHKDTNDLIRLCNLATLTQAGAAVLAMDNQVRSLREFVTSHVRVKEAKKLIKIGALISSAVNYLDDFAKSRKVDLKFEVDDSEVLVEILERDVVRALINILHNAIKYSWQRTKGENAYVSIRTVREPDFISIEVEDHGVAVPEEEINQESIFQIGFRGRLSGVKGRMGTGIGLHDARSVVREHGGDVVVQSHPAVFGRVNNDYTHPFLTTVTMKLRIYKG